MRKNLLGALALLPTLCLAQGKADLVIWNGTIYTANSSQQVVEAIAVKGDSIVYAGDMTSAKPWIGENTELVDIRGHTRLWGQTSNFPTTTMGSQTTHDYGVRLNLPQFNGHF